MSTPGGRLILQFIRQKYGLDAMREFQDQFGGGRYMIPSFQAFVLVALESDVLDDYRKKPHGDMTAFYAAEARKYDCHPKTVERALARALKKKQAA